MKRSTLSAMFLLSLVLSQHAQCADTKAAKGPLTAAEKIQCRVQLAEFNKGVQAYNAELDAIKALETEIEALSAALDKEQAAVDRRDSVAMQALNTQIGKNNELVARHTQMGLSLKAMSSESAERSAQFLEACESGLLAPSLAAKIPPADAACSSTTGAKDVEQQIKATFVEVRANEKQRQAEVERVVDARAKAQSWSDEKRCKIFLELLVSPKFMAFEREKQPYVQELMRIMGSKPKNGPEECRLLQRIAATLPAIKAINTRQYAFMADQIRVAK